MEAEFISTRVGMKRGLETWDGMFWLVGQCCQVDRGKRGRLEDHALSPTRLLDLFHLITDGRHVWT